MKDSEEVEKKLANKTWKYPTSISLNYSLIFPIEGRKVQFWELSWEHLKSAESS